MKIKSRQRGRRLGSPQSRRTRQRDSPHVLIDRNGRDALHRVENGRGETLDRSVCSGSSILSCDDGGHGTNDRPIMKPKTRENMSQHETDSKRVDAFSSDSAHASGATATGGRLILPKESTVLIETGAGCITVSPDGVVFSSRTCTMERWASRLSEALNAL